MKESFNFLQFAERASKFIALSIAALPLFFVVVNSLRSAQWKLFPFAEVANFHDMELTITLNCANYVRFFSDQCYLHAVLTSAKLALWCVLFVVPVGFCIAVGLYQMPRKFQRVAMVAIVTPMFIPFVVKLYSWMYISEEYLCRWLEKRLAIKIATWLFCCHSYLPIAVLFIRDDLNKIDPDIPSAAADLGASGTTVAMRILLPMVRNSLLTSIATTAILAFGEFVIPDILGNGVINTIGCVANTECLVFHDLPMSATVSVFMILWSMIPVVLCKHLLVNSQLMCK